MQIFHFIFFFLISAIIIPIISTTFYPAKSPIFSYHGRYQSFNNNNSIKYDWSCFKISFCYKNISKLSLHIQDTWNFYDVVFKNNQTVKLSMKKEKITQINRGKYQEGCVEIIKITENHYGPLGSHTDSIFNGVTIDNGLTTAFGDMSNRNPTCMLKMRKSQNCRYSWATLISQMFQADYRIVAISGRGVTRNAIGVPGQTMPHYFTRTTSNSAQFSYHYEDSFFSDVIFILLGGNDFANIHPSRNNFIQQYKSMLTLILKQYLSKSIQQKRPKLICLCESGEGSQLCLMTRQAVKEMKFSYSQVYYVKMPQGVFIKDNLGCVAHPNKIGQMLIAEGVYHDAKKILEGHQNQEILEGHQYKEILKGHLYEKK